MSSNEYFRKRRKEAMANGLCTQCFKRPAKPGYTQCEECIVDRRKRNRKKAAESRKLEAEAERERKKPKESVDDVAVKARRAGMSYGKYLAWMSGKLKRQEGE